MGTLLSGTESKFLAACEREQDGLTKIRELVVRNEELKGKNKELEESLIGRCVLGGWLMSYPMPKSSRLGSQPYNTLRTLQNI